MAKAKAKPQVREIEVDAPAGLGPFEVHAFRLGLLRGMLALADEIGHEIPGIYRQAFENEIAFREWKLAGSGLRQEGDGS